MRTLLLIIGSLLPVVSSATYVVSIWRGQTRPERMTRFLLMIITLLMFGSLWLGGDTSGVWLALISFVQAMVIWVLSLRRGMGGRDTLDFVCLGLCAVGIVVWVASGRAWAGMLISIVADIIATAPAIRKTIRWPGTELALFYILDTFAGIAIMLAGPYTVSAMVFPAYIIFINIVFVIAIRWPRRVPELDATEG